MAEKKRPTRRVQTEPRNERWQKFMRGEITIADMDDEELARAQFRAGDGSFRGRPPKTVPRDFAQQVSRELLSRVDSRFKQMMMDAVATAHQIMLGGEKDADKLRAANLVIERVLGKVPERVVVSPGKSEWESAVDEFVAGLEDEKISRARVVLGRGEE